MSREIKVHEHHLTDELLDITDEVATLYDALIKRPCFTEGGLDIEAYDAIITIGTRMGYTMVGTAIEHRNELAALRKHREQMEHNAEYRHQWWWQQRKVFIAEMIEAGKLTAEQAEDLP